MPEQQDLTEHEEHCSTDPQTMAALGLEVNQQVRITRNGPGGVRGLATVAERRDADTGAVVRMGFGGRSRYGDGEVFDAAVSTPVARSDLSDGEAQQTGEFVERLTDDGAQAELIVLAPHGGRIEPHTDEQAAQMASHFPADRVSTWLCRGFGDASESWHITSDDLNPASFPLLGQVIGRGFRHAVSFHGLTPADVLVGGAAPKSFRGDRRRRQGGDRGLRPRRGVAAPGDPLGGDAAANVVNRLTGDDGASGVPIEQSPRARKEHGAAIADAVAGVYQRLAAEAGAGVGP